MALNFPNSPVDGQIYYDTTTGAKYVWEAASSKWKSMQYTSTIVAFGYQTANAAYDTTNAAFAMANAAYNVQNVDFTLSNSAFTHANAAFDVANNALPNVSNAVFAGNLRITGNLQIGTNTVTIRDNHIISAEYYRMNTANHMVAIPDGNRVNTIFSLVNVSFDTANASYNSANNVGPQIAPTYNTANAAFDVANTAYASINSNWTVTNALYSVANSAFDSANNVGPQIAPTYNTANAAYNQANAAYNGSNAGYTTANAAFAFANTRFSSSGGTISGAVEITADLTVHGNTRFIDQQTLQVGDPLIYLAANNYTSDVVDIGFIANYVNATSSNVHTGLFRSSGSKEYYLFQGYDKEPINNYIDPVGNNITMAVLNATVRTSNLILGGANTINWITSNYITTNTAYASINSNWTVTNTVYGVANAAFGVANTVTNYLPLSGGTMTGALNIGTATNLSFGSAVRQMVNLWSTSYGIGVQSSTQYFRTGSRFSWHRNGIHSDTENDPGTGGTLAMTLDGSSHLTAYGSMRSPIFYDSDNTGYYVDPSSTSNFYGGTFNTTLGISSGTSTGLNITTSSSGPWALQLIRSDVGSTVQVFNNNGHWYFGQYVVALGSMRSPLFYDSDNTGYYVDPNSGSLLNQLTTYAHFFGGQGGDSGQSNHSYAIYQAGGAWTSPYPDLRIAYHTGIQLGAQTGYGGIRFYSEETMVNEIMSVGNGDSHVRITNNLYANFPSLFQSTTNATTSGDRSLGYSTSWTNHLSVTFTTTKTGPVYAGMVLAMTYESAAVQGEAQFYLTGPSNFTSQYMAVAQQSDANRARGAHSMTWMFGNVPAGSYTLYLQVRNNGSGSTWILNNYLGFDTLYCSYM